jgi:hypothetical protein
MFCATGTVMPPPDSSGYTCASTLPKATSASRLAGVTSSPNSTNQVMMTALARSAPVDLLAHGRLHPLIPAIGECSGSEQPVPVDRDQIVLRNTWQVGPAAFSVALKVTPQTQRVHLDEGRA